MLVDAISAASNLRYVPRTEDKLEPWQREDATTLQREWGARRPEGVSQEDFGAEYGIGNQAMVSQYLRGERPLNIWAAAKFARGLKCTIEDIAPNLAERARTEILPVLSGKLDLRKPLYSRNGQKGKKQREAS